MAGKRKRGGLKRAPVAEGGEIRGVRVRAVTPRGVAWDDDLIAGALGRIGKLEEAIAEHLKTAAAADKTIAERTEAKAPLDDDRLKRAMRAAAAQRRFAARKEAKIAGEQEWIEELRGHRQRAAAEGKAVELPETVAAECEEVVGEDEDAIMAAAREFAWKHGVGEMVDDDGLICVTAMQDAERVMARRGSDYSEMYENTYRGKTFWPSVFDAIEEALCGSKAPVETPAYLGLRDPLELTAYRALETPGLIHSAVIDTAAGVRRSLPVCSADEMNGVAAKLKSAGHAGKVFDASVYEKLLEAKTPPQLDDFAEMIDARLEGREVKK